MQYGLLGQTLKHSYSPQIHRQLGEYAYSLFECSPEELESFMKSNNFQGLNVTMPYKKAVIPYLDALTPQAKLLGAVNTVVRQADGSLLGHNSDYFGFAHTLERAKLSVTGKKVLLLGSGGAAATVNAVMTQAGAKVISVSRSGPVNYDNIDMHSDATIIVNATPVGMYPDTEAAPVTLNKFLRLEAVFDLIYNPARTKLLLEAEKKGVPCFNGLWMLVAQAKESAEYFTGRKISNERIPQIHQLLQQQMENIVLIGMPGCGKSHIGRLLAKELGKQFVDTDEIVEELAGISIPEIFATSGEERFRTLETQALRYVSNRSGLVISTGGGCVTKPENYPILHQNGKIIWLQRAINDLETKGRPLSQSGRLQDMLSVRSPFYQQFADHIVSNNSTAENTIKSIMDLLRPQEEL